MSRLSSALIDERGHVLRFSDSSQYDFVCVLCGGRDYSGDDTLALKCRKAIREDEEERWVSVNPAFPKYVVERNFRVDEPTYRYRPWGHGAEDEPWTYGEPPAEQALRF